MSVNHHLRLALDVVRDAVAVVESAPLQQAGPRVVYANQAMADATGMPARQLESLPLGVITDSLPSLFGAMQKAPARSGEIPGTLRHQPSGRLLPCQWICTPVKDNRGVVLSYIVTARLHGAAGPAQGAGAEPGTRTFDAPPPAPDAWQQDVVEFIRDSARYVAHEFNNALTAVLLPVQMVIRQLPDQGELQNQLAVAHDSAQRAAALAKDFLDCFRPRPPQLERCRLDELLGRALRLATCAQNIHWDLDIQTDLWEVEVDSSQIERVIFNLVRNACQAMPGGGRLLVKATNNEVTADAGHGLQPGPHVLISVRDWGPGIPEENMPHLFHSRFTTKQDGNGCGLPICYQIIRSHRGEMFVQSRPQVGTAFLMFLPAAGVRSPMAPPAAAPARLSMQDTAPVPPPQFAPPEPVHIYPGGAAHSQPRREPSATAPLVPPIAPPVPEPAADAPPALLVIDDEDGVRRALVQLGRHYGLHVDTAANGEEGIQFHRDRFQARRCYDIILVDINLHGSLNGIEVFHAIRRIDPDAAIVATSGICSEADVERYTALGFSGFLPKPFQVEDFDEMVAALLAPAAD